MVRIPSLRIRDDYFVIATFGFQVIAFSIMNNWVGFTGGPHGTARDSAAESLRLGGVVQLGVSAFECDAGSSGIGSRL